LAKEREPPTLADYVVTAVSPVLIMGLVGSLAFFLLDILYAGQHAGRLQWTLFWFVAAAVLVARISIQLGAAQAWGYGIALGGATFLAMWRFVQYGDDHTAVSTAGPVVNLIIIAVVLRSANKLTWDCTFVDETAEDGGAGLLDEIKEELQSEPAAGGLATEDSPGRKARPMGRWVVYFSLAALPLFGLGQALIPAADEGRRRYAFWLMTIYVASGLGLLLTTTLLGLRRYLRQRKLQMPIAMTGLWLGIGAALIAAFLLAGTLLPRPLAEYALIPIKPLSSRDRDASRHAMGSDSPGKGEGRGGAKGQDENAKDGSGGKGQAGGEKSGQSGKPEGQGGTQSGGQGKGDSKAKDGGGQKGQDGKLSGGDQADNRRSSDSAKSGDAVRKMNETDRSRDGDQTSTEPTNSSPGVVGALANILKWIALIILAIVLILGVLWFVARHLAGASDWARKLFEALNAFWRSLFGGPAPETEDVVESVVVQERPRPFTDFRNPFADGAAAGWSSDELVRYSFVALEAWAFERDLPRRPDETPLEFADRIATEVPALALDSQRLIGLYAGLAYARRRLPEASREQVRAFWQTLEQQASGVAAASRGREGPDTGSF
jgi:hypothetical protein